MNASDTSPEKAAQTPPPKRKTTSYWEHKPGGEMPACESAENPDCTCECRGALHSRRLIDAVLKIPADLRPVYTDTPDRPLTVAELLDRMQAARSRKMLRPLGDDVVITAAIELLLAEGECTQLKGEAATLREKTMLWCAFADLMAGVHTLAPEDGTWWELSWQVRAGARAERVADWITQQVGFEPSEASEERNAASSETWPVMLTAAARALDATPPGEPLTPDPIVTVAEDDTMRRYIWPRQRHAVIIRELQCPPVVRKIAEIIADALNACELARADQLLVLRATAAGICASTWHSPHVVRYALLPAVANLLSRGAPLHWMNQRQLSLSPSDVIARLLGNRWEGYSSSW